MRKTVDKHDQLIDDSLKSAVQMNEIGADTLVNLGQQNDRLNTIQDGVESVSFCSYHIHTVYTSDAY